MQTYVICEDDKQQLDRIKQLLDTLTVDKEILLFSSGNELLIHLHELKDNTIFLMDVVLEELSGIDIAKMINQTIRHSAIIFISAYLEKVTEIYDATHCYFVYKPELERRLPKALSSALNQLNRSKAVLWLETSDKTIRLEEGEIFYIERVKRTTYVYCSKQVYQCTQNIQYFVEHLSSSFIQCHRSFLVNPEYVKEYRRSEFLLHNAYIIPISRAYQKYAKERFQKFIISKVNQIAQ